MQPTPFEPGGEEGFGLSVGPGGVEVPDTAGEGRVEHAVCIPFHLGNVRLAVQVLAVAKVDVAGSSEGRQPETDRADLQARAPQRSLLTRTRE
jgi:hypothetical protein